MKPIHCYPIAEARDKLPTLIREVEATAAVVSFSSALGRFREQVDVAALELGPELFKGMRQMDVRREPITSD